MKKRVLNSTILAAIATLTFSPFVAAHHPSEDVNPNFDLVDSRISDMHNEVIDAMYEDGDLMATTARGTDAVSSPTMSTGVGANATETATQSATQVTSAPGRGTGSASRSGR